MIFGEYSFENHILLNPIVDDDEFLSTHYHEFTHFMLSHHSTTGILMYCLVKIGIVKNSNDFKKYEILKKFLYENMKNVQEGLAVFSECIMKLLKGKKVYEEFIRKLKNNNRTYYRYLEPLLFILKITEIDNKEEIRKTAQVIFSIGIEAMNTEILKEDPKKFSTNKEIQKMISTPNFAKNNLPNSRFKSYLKEIEKIDNSKKLQSKGILLLSDEVKKPTLEYAEKRLKQIKKFILSFFEDSKLIDEYKIRLENINIKEIDIDELYSKQIPTTFNEDIYQKNLKNIADISIIKKYCEERTSMIFLIGKIENTLRDFKIHIIPNELKKSIKSEKELIFFYSLQKREILSSIVSEKDIRDLYKNTLFSSVILTTYKNYNYNNDCIDGYEDIDKKIFIYCDRTYYNTKSYFDLWKKREIFYQYIEYKNMIVLIIKIKKDRFFVLPITSTAFPIVSEDIKKNRKNMKIPPYIEGGFIYDKEIIIGEDMMNYIDTIINSLFFIDIDIHN